MPKAKLKIVKNEIERLKVAAFLSNVTIGTGQLFGETVVAEVSARNVSDLFELGRQLEKLPVDAQLPTSAPAQETTEKPAAKSKKAA